MINLHAFESAAAERLPRMVFDYFAGGANDGVVRVEETQVEGMRERVVLPVSHSAMLVSARVAAQLGTCDHSH